MVACLWRRALPNAVKQAVAHYDFTKASLKDVLQVADDVYQSTRPATATVAAIDTSVPPPSDLSTEEVLNNAFHPLQPSQAAQVAQIAAIYHQLGRGRGGIVQVRGRGNNRGRGRGGRNGGGRGGQRPQYSAQNPRHTSPRHPDLPPFGVCKRHWQFGKSNFTCLEPYTCEWKNFIQPKPQN